MFYKKDRNDPGHQLVRIVKAISFFFGTNGWSNPFNTSTIQKIEIQNIMWP